MVGSIDYICTRRWPTKIATLQDSEDVGIQNVHHSVFYVHCYAAECYASVEQYK